MRVPGAAYSLLLAVAAWAVEYFTEGAGGGIPWAPILVAAIPVILKAITVQAPPEPMPEGAVGAPRGAGDEPSKMTKFVWGG